LKATKKIGIMGGTFNPIHNGHLLLAESAYYEFDLDEVLIMPTKNPYYKNISSTVKEEDRVNMVCLAIEDNPHFALSTEELNRDGTTYTVETLRNLTKANPDCEYFFIMGADSLYHIESWKEPEEILKMAVIVVADRDGGNSSILKSQIAYIMNKYEADIRLLNSPYLEISSHDIRKRVREGQSIRYLLPHQVREYIYKYEIYNYK
jgi:nicotinate-nucleotide adenylyltransferase